MKLPFVIEQSDFKFEPRRQWAQRDDLDPVDKNILNALDEFEQTNRKLIEETVTTRQLLLLVCVATAPQLLLLWQKFFGE